jgi:site-specific recombinase XerD
MTGSVLPPLSGLIQSFFQEHLLVERNVSPNTVLAYRDSVKLFLRYASGVNACSPDELAHEAFDVPTVRGFLVHLDVSHQRRREDTAAGGREPRRFRGGADETATEDRG